MARSRGVAMLVAVAAMASGAALVACAKATDGQFEGTRVAAADGSATDPVSSPDDAAAADPEPTIDAGPPPRDAAPAEDVRKPPPANEGGSTCASPCEIAPQCGCGPTSTCDIVTASGGVACVVAGTFGRGAGCTSTSAYAPGLSCIEGTCHEFCARADAGACPAGGGCIPAQVEGTPPPNLLICETGCELADPAACATGAPGVTSICVDDGEGLGTDCVGVPPANVSTPSGVCNDTKVCPSGSVCTVESQGATDGTCRKWCRVGGSDCTGCVGFSNPTVSHGGKMYGYCP